MFEEWYKSRTAKIKEYMKSNTLGISMMMTLQKELSNVRFISHLMILQQDDLLNKLSYIPGKHRKNLRSAIKYLENQFNYLSSFEKKDFVFGDKKYLRIEIFTDTTGPNKQDFAILGGEELKLSKIKLGESFYSSPVKVFESKDGEQLEIATLTLAQNIQPMALLSIRISKLGFLIARNVRWQCLMRI